MAMRRGRFEEADGGTIFLDEVGEMSLSMQAKLLRVLQERAFERVGGNTTIKVDLRILAATNRDLADMVAKGTFREDLYYRLNVMPISLPALRERMEDLPEIARHLAERIGSSQGRKVSLTETAVRRLLQHSWPGNIRELENCLERASVMSESGSIDADQVRIDRIRETQNHSPTPRSSSGISMAQHAGGSSSGNDYSPAPAMPSRAPVDVNDPGLDERERVVAALEQAGWVQAKAARLLGMTPRQIAYRIQTLNIEVKQF